MKSLVSVVLAVSLSFVAMPAMAEDTCSVLSDLAKTIMTKRQDGASMTDMMAIVKDRDSAAGQVTKAMIIGAYEIPAYSTDEVKQRTITDFSNQVALECYKAAD